MQDNALCIVGKSETHSKLDCAMRVDTEGETSQDKYIFSSVPKVKCMNNPKPSRLPLWRLPALAPQ